MRIGEQRGTGAVGLAVMAMGFAFPLLLVAGVSASDSNVSSLAEELELQYAPDVVLVMKDKRFHVVQGVDPNQTSPYPSFFLAPGMDVVLLIRNEDEVAHEFVSPLLQKVDLQISGRATMVYTHMAAGVRVDPKEAVLLRFDVPDAGFDQFHFWCNIHGKLFGDPMRGEIFVLKQSAR